MAPVPGISWFACVNVCSQGRKHFETAALRPPNGCFFSFLCRPVDYLYPLAVGKTSVSVEGVAVLFCFFNSKSMMA